MKVDALKVESVWKFTESQLQDALQEIVSVMGTLLLAADHRQVLDQTFRSEIAKDLHTLADGYEKGNRPRNLHVARVAGSVFSEPLKRDKLTGQVK